MTQPAGVLAPYDALLLVSFGGPEGPEEVMPFLQSVTGGRGIPQARIEEVATHYLERGGVSPINDETRDLLAALRSEMDDRGHSLPIYWGNRHLEPSLPRALEEAQAGGARRVLAVLTSAYPSYSSCRQYRENLAAASTEVRSDVEIDKLDPYALSAGFLSTMTRVTQQGIDRLTDPGASEPLRREAIRLVFVTHSVPTSLDITSGPLPHPVYDAPDASVRPVGEYARMHREVADRISAAVGLPAGDLVYCSRSGPPTQPWLEPDIGDHLRALAAEDASIRGVVVVPIGFVADHMEVVNDLDDEAGEVAAEVGLQFVRVPTVRADEVFVAGLVDLIEERAAQARNERPRTVRWCTPGCCPNQRADLPTLCDNLDAALADADGSTRADTAHRIEGAR